MISIALTVIVGMMAYSYGAPPPSKSYEGSSNSGFDTAPFVQLQRKCFDKAAGETKNAAQDVRQQRFDTCFALHEAMVKHATAKLSGKEAASVKHDIDRALHGVEKNYAKKMGVAMPSDAK